MAHPLALGLFPIPFEPDGRIRTRITYLEMTAAPAARHYPTPSSLKLALLRAERCPVGYYRYLYDAVGQPWLWTDRKRMADEDIEAIIHDERVTILIPYVGGVPAGFAELDARAGTEVNLSYFGLAPEFLGLRVGGFFLRRVVAEAWAGKTTRLTVNTCTLDHPRALAVYQSVGFTPIATRDVLFDPGPYAAPPAA